MPTYRFHPVTASLWLWDTPLAYTPPTGPGVAFTVAYNQRELSQPQTFTYANLGPRWRFTWQASVLEGGTSSAEVSLPRGGTEFYRPAGGGAFLPSPRSGARLVRTSESPLRFERWLTDGSVEVYGQSDGAAPGWRRVFLTELRDPQGQALTFTWDAQLRLVAVSDALGQVTTLAYEHPTDPLKITRVTDPFGRTATFTYTAAGQLESLTDAIGLTSRVTYGASDFVTSLTTPYGTTTFRHEADATQT
jgi:YD repeat-containing protein